MRIFRAALLLGVATLPAAAMAQSAPVASVASVKPLAYTERTLANGLRVYAIRDTSTATVAVHVWYDVGSKDDPKGRSGFAHMFEHLMFKATRNLVPEQFDRLTEDVGGYNNASTNDDFTNYYETVPANHLQRILFAEADRMASLVVEPKTFASERDVVKEELRLRVLAQPYGKLFSLYFPETAYSVHPYARPGIGSIEDLEAASIDDVRAFHATYYRPDNAVLVVAGNFDPAELDQWVDRYFAPIKKPDRPIPRVTVTEPERTAPINRTVYEANTPLPAVLISYPIPADRNPDSAALAVLDAILSAGESSRLYESLVYRDQLAQSAGTFLDSKQSTGSFAAYAILAGGKTADAGVAALKREIARLRDAPVSVAELSEAKNELLTAAIRGRETADGKASTLARAIVIDGDASAADRQLAEIAAVTAADVQRVAEKYLTDNRSATIRYLPKGDNTAKGDTIGVASTVQVAPLVPPADIAVVTPAPAAERLLPPPPGAPIAAAIPEPVESRLANGMRLIVVEKHELPLIAASVVVGGGGALDPASRAGLGNLTAELLTKGTRTRSATQIAREIESLGGSIDSDADWDGASVNIGVKSDQAGPALAILADVAMHPAFAQQEIDRARTQSIDGIGVELKDPAQLANFVATRAVFGSGPYGHLLSGTPASLKTISRADVTANYAASWRPDRATLIMVGDVTPAAAKALAEKNFAGWQAPGTAPAATIIAPASYPAPRVIVVDFPGAGQAGVVVARPGIARKDPAYYPVAVANATLGVGFSSRLNQEIRIKRGLAYGAGSSVSARLAPGPISARTQTKNPSAAEVVALIIAEMKRLGSEAAPAAELETRKAVLIGGFGRSSETTSGIAGIIGGYVINQVPLSELKTYAGAIERVDPAAVEAAAAKLLDPASASIVVVGESKQFIDALRKAYPKLELIPATALDLNSPSLRASK
ncbi:MAG: peptidase M16 [Sphingomonas sp. 28-66-16]|nr:MAG: peptidase M16 [Sphingomonas sp. 28-66-16]